MLKKYIKILAVIIILLQSLNYINAKPKEYFIECDPNDFKMINNNPYEEIYIPITFTHNGKSWDRARMRIRGDGSRWFPKRSLKINFKSEKFLNGRDKLNFNAEYEDHSYVCQYLARRAFKKAGYPCFDAEHARLYLNGKYLGLYLRIENMDGDFLEDKGLDRNGNLYKATLDDASLSIYDDVDIHWEKKTNEFSGREDLEKLIDSLFYVPDEDYYNFARRTFDYAKMIDIIAINMLIANGSTYYHNYYMYHDIYGTNKWTMLAWDMDKTFYKVGYLYPYNRSSSHNSPDNPFFERALICEPIFNDIRKRIDNLSEEFFNNEFFDPIIDSLKNDIRTSVVEDESDDIIDEEFWLSQIEKNKKYVSERLSRLEYQFDNWPRSFKTDPTLGYYYDSVNFIWGQSRHPAGNEVSYDFYFGSKENLNDTTATTIVRGLKDTSFVKTGLINEGEYFWKVMACDGVECVDGFNYPNRIKIKRATNLPCVIDNETILSEANSPYKIDCDLLVKSDLIVEAGARLLLGKNSRITVTGNLTIVGESNNPVIIEPAFNGEYWDMIYVTSGKLTMKNCFMYDGIIKSKNADLDLDNVVLKSRYKDLTWVTSYIFGDSGSMRFNKVSIESDGVCEGIRLIDCNGAYTSDCVFNNAPDAVEYINMDNGVIKNCRIYNATDDGIDINNCDNTEIIGNLIVNAFDKGISIGNEEVGPSRNTLVKNNIIAGCREGIAVKDSSDAIIINNSLHDNITGIHLYEKFSGFGGGFAEVKNTIISGSVTSIKKDEYSSISISYSLSDRELFEGIGNIKADPHFSDSDNLNFALQSISPCIDAGDPESPLDPDGTRADIGAIPTGVPIDLPKIVINEINYKSSEEFDSGDWVEFYNADEQDINMSNWVFMDDNDDHRFMFPENFILKSDDYIVLCRNIDKFRTIFPEVIKYIGEIDFGFSSDGELLRLYDNSKVLIDSLTYGVTDPWTDLPNGKGHTLELIEALSDNALAENWTHSEGIGSPGTENGSKNNVSYKLNIKNFGIYPNPADRKANIILYLNQKQHGRIEIYDRLGRKINKIYDGIFSQGLNQITYGLDGLAPGIYYCTLTIGESRQTRILSCIK